MNENLSKSISSIMAYFDFNKVAEIEKTFFNTDCESVEELSEKIKDFTLDNLYSCAKEFGKKKMDCWEESMYHLHFDYIYDEENPRMELKYIPISWEMY